MITRNGKHSHGVHKLDGMSQTLVHGAEEGATKVAEVVESAGARMAKGAGQVAKGAGQAGGRASELTGQLKGHAGELSGQLKGHAGELSGQLKGHAGELSGQLKGHAGELSGQLKDQAGGLSGQLKDQAGGLSGQLKDQAGGLSGQLKDQAGGLSGQLKSHLDLGEARHGLRGAKRGVREMVLGSVSRPRTKRSRGRLLPSGDAMLKAQLVRTSRELAHESSDLNAAVDSLNSIIKSNRRAAARGRTRLLGGIALGAAIMYHLDADQGRQRRAATGRMIADIVRGQRQPPVA